MTIQRTPEEQSLLKRSIKADGCKALCDFKPFCHKPKDMTCGEYINSLIKWEIKEGKTG